MANKTKEEKILDTFERSMNRLGNESSEKLDKIKSKNKFSMFPKANSNVKKQLNKKKKVTKEKPIGIVKKVVAPNQVGLKEGVHQRGARIPRGHKTSLRPSKKGKKKLRKPIQKKIKTIKNLENVKESIKKNQRLKAEINPNEKSIKKNKKVFSKKTNYRKIKVIKNTQTLQLRTESEIAMDFATKAYKRFNKLIKSIILFGSTSKKTNVVGSDIDIIMILDDASVKWDQELIVWYREELGKITRANPYRKNLHINTIKLTTWFQDLLRGDPIVINIIRDGESLIDFGGFFEPLKYLLASGKIKSTPEAIYSLLQRAPQHISRSKVSELNAIEGLFWAMVDSAHAALIAGHKVPPSPEHIPIELKESFVDSKMLKMKYVLWYRDLFLLHKKITHGEITNLKGVEIDEWQERTEEFLKVMARLVKDLI
jgi:predicted nucleotidyltransferase